MRGDLIERVTDLKDRLSEEAGNAKDVLMLINVLQVLNDVKCLASGWDVFNKDEYYKGGEDDKSNG